MYSVASVSFFSKVFMLCRILLKYCARSDWEIVDALSIFCWIALYPSTWCQFFSGTRDFACKQVPTLLCIFKFVPEYIRSLGCRGLWHCVREGGRSVRPWQFPNQASSAVDWIVMQRDVGHFWHEIISVYSFLAKGSNYHSLYMDEIQAL